MKGRLQPTRSIGDYHLKKREEWKGPGEFRGPYLTHEPEISVYEVKKEDRYILIGSDGLWDFVKK